MQLALYRDKNGRVVHQYPFILVIDPWLNQGHLFTDAQSLGDSLFAAKQAPDPEADTAIRRLAEQGWRIHFIRSDADLTDELMPYFAISEGQLQEVIAARWLQQNFSFPGAESVVWEHTTTRLYTDGERVICAGHTIELRPDAIEPGDLHTRVAHWLETFGRDVAAELKAPFVHLPTPRP